jgi:hypothetical protein
MKKLLLILLCLPLLSLGQNDEIIKLQNEVNDINYKLNEHHKEFNRGIIISVIGVVTTTIGAIVATPAVIIIGGVTSLYGQISVIGSHRWFKKKRKVGETNLEITSDREYHKSLEKLEQYTKYYKLGRISEEEYNMYVKKLKEDLELLKQ